MIPGLPAPLASLRAALAVAGLLAVLAVLAAVYLLGRSHEAAGWRLKAAQAAAATERAIAIEQGRQRSIEQQWRATVDQQAQELTHARKTIADHAARLAALRLDAGQLRNQLAGYAAGPPGADPAATCPARAAALAAYGADLGAAAAAVGRAARQAALERDQFAAEVLACARAWPTAPGVTDPFPGR